VRLKGDEATVTTPIGGNLGDIDAMMRERGLDPADWTVLDSEVRAYEALAQGRGEDGAPVVVTLHYLKAKLRRKVAMVLVSPAVHVPPVDIPPVSPRIRLDEPDLVVVEGDHQVPYVDSALHRASLAFLAEMSPVEHVFLGDTADFPTISRHADHPAAMASTQECIQAAYDLLRAKREAAPAARARKLKGNHDWRVESELLARAERMYGIAPADTGEGEELPALSLRRLLHLDQIGIDLVEDPRGWEHAEVELVPGPLGLVVRHGWITGANTAERSLQKRGRSIIVGHTHSREHAFVWDPSAGAERQAAVAGTMSLVRDQRFPHFAVADSWLQGFATVTRWRDGRFQIEHARWDGESLVWRDRRWTP
jgi:hypothetical protein